MNNFKDVLCDLVAETQLSLRKLAEKSGISATQYGKYLKGTYPTLAVADRLAKYFNCSLDYLFGLSDKQETYTKEYDLTKFLPRYEKTLNINKISHYQFAKKVDMSESCKRHWKANQIPDIESLIKITEFFKVSIDYLVGKTN